MVYKKTQMYTVSTQRTEPKKTKMTKEEIFLLDELSKQSQRGIFFHANAVIVPLLPLWTFSRILGMELEYHCVRIAIVTGICAFLLWFACNEMRISFKGKLRTKSKKPIQEILRPKEEKQGGRSDKNALALLNKDRSVDGEACGFALFYNNCYFLSLVLLFSHVGFQRLDVENNYVVSMVLAAFVITVLASTMRSNK